MILMRIHIFILTSVLVFFSYLPSFAVTTYIWNGSVSTAWNVNANWTPNTGFPSGATDIATINNAAVPNICALDASRTIGVLNVSAGTFDLGGFVITADETNFTGGIVRNGSVFAANLKEVKSTTFNGTITLKKLDVGNSNSIWYGGNTFNGTTSIICAHSSKYIITSNNVADDYNGNVTFQRLSSGYLYAAYYGLNTFSGNISTAGTLNSIDFCGFGAGGGGAAVTAMIIDGTGPQIFTTDIGKPAYVTNLKMATTGAGGLTLNGSLVIYTNLNLVTGIITTSNVNTLTLNDEDVTSNIGNSGSYINGPMDYVMSNNSTTTLTFPIGKDADWRPAVLTLNHSSPASYTYRAEVFNASAEALGWTKPATVNLVSLTHYWDIKRYATSSLLTEVPTTDLSGNQTVTLYYAANDLVTDPANLTICKNTSTAPTTWIDIGGSGATITSGSVSSTSAPSAFNSFSRFTLGNKSSGTNTLPIELLTFRAIQNSTVVDLNWSTASETGNNFFTIERSKDGANFEFVSDVKGAGNCTFTNNYASIDSDPYQGESYYRLKQTDNNGVYSYSTIVAVDFKNTSEFSFDVFPNPCDGSSLNIAYNVPKTEKLQVIIYDVNGNECFSKVILTEENGKIDCCQKLSTGLYLIRVSSKSYVCSKRLIVR